MFEVIPAIDLRGGKCVRLMQGDYARETVYGADPVEMALRWQSLGAPRLHVVDLDGARSGEQAVRMFGDEVFQAGMNVFGKGLDKQDEYYADQRGMVLAARGGYNPYGLAGVLQTLDSSGGANGGMALMLSTHPNPGDRIERLLDSVGDKLDAYSAVQTPGRMYRPGN